MLNDSEVQHLMALFKKVISPYFKMFSYLQQGKVMRYSDFFQFCSAFGIFPDLIHKQALHNLYHVLNNQKKSQVDEA